LHDLGARRQGKKQTPRRLTAREQELLEIGSTSPKYQP
jgi:hypothetical protein